MLEGEAGAVGVTDATVTRTVLAAMRADGGRTAVADRGRELRRARFADAVRAAARGLRWHGVRAGDVGAIHLADACDLAVAVHAVGAAGAVPAPLPPGASAEEAARMMNEVGARFLLTGADTAARSLAAADASYVRQVFAFGNVPGATPFGRLLERGVEIGEVPSPDPLRDAALRLAGPREDVTHADRLADLYRLGGAVALGEDDVLVCCGSDVPVRTWIGLIDLCLVQGAAFAGVREPGARDLLEAILRYDATAVVVSPAKLRALAFDHGAVPMPGVRVLVAGAPSAEAAHACRVRHGWTVATLS
ncbi:AMP-binding protein [Actinomadura opuntiae]|uniref:AMP-binding protein n=1 Tax=Actinomadura sp. OS1-43 TaxID=604315 RepID=UPI00255AA963|nr:AMP-binding protein [Actinomadura sp. OS1-43]MDL4819556.1 AMP-binding protein [Actinomadura sp. OS1-43]